MERRSFGVQGKFLNSAKAAAGAQHLLEKVEDGRLTMDILPNNYEQFTGELEEKDYLSFCRFLQSLNGKKILNLLEEEDAGQFVEL